MSIKVKVTNASHGHWYQEYIGEVFDVEKSGLSNYTLYLSESNYKIMNEEPDDRKRQELLRRLKNTGTGMKLGINKKNCTEVGFESNKEATGLLSKEW